ncbi:MAG: endonuclease MutS2 [Myxococcota bacterium]
MLSRTLAALDWDAVCTALAEHARTSRGAAAARSAPLYANAGAVREAYEAVEEVRAVWHDGDDPPVGGVGDVAAAVDRAHRGVVLDPGELREVDATARALDALARWCEPRGGRLAALAAPISIDPGLLEELRGAFDATGALSARRWPELGQLRQRIATLKDRVRDTLEDILKSPDWEDLLQDRFVTERGGRLVVPVKTSHRRGLGIVHGHSHSGETAFVEPAAVVELHNELREAESELARTEHRLLGALSGEVGRRHVALLDALAAATEIDLAVARAGLGRALEGTVPRVGNEGVLVLRGARHPLLALKGAVVANDLALTPERPGLVLTGPNAGGKTVALKTLGLCAAMARAAIPLPCGEDSRVDVFEIVADVGDAQSVAAGLSTFSAHVAALKGAIAAARTGALVLLDEVAVGTDPAQGAALARAVLETIVDAGARVAVTTHYPELKAITDPRFVVAAAQFEAGHPTYRLVTGTPGPSYALVMASALGLPEHVVTRARALLDDAAREMAERLERLTEERAALEGERRALAARIADAERREAALRAAEEKLAKEGRRELDARIAKWRERMRAQEDRVREMVAVLQAGGDLRAANATLAEIRAMRSEQGGDARGAGGDSWGPGGDSWGRASRPPLPPPEVKAGDRVRLRTLGQVGRVLTAGDPVEVEVGSMRVRVALSDLALVSGTPHPAFGHPLPAPRGEGHATDVRTPSNTLDLRGQRVDDALLATERWLDVVSRTPEKRVYLLHGHGTGALKTALRQWLPQCRYVRSWRPADADEGGDAFTALELR